MGFELPFYLDYSLPVLFSEARGISAHQWEVNRKKSDSRSKTMKKSNMKTLIVSITVALLTASLFLTGCGKAVSKADYEKIRVGMSKKEVVELLGKPGTQSESEL
jgi:hypothetical protein